MLIFPILTGILILVLAGILSFKLLKRKVSFQKMEEISSFIKKGAYTYLLRQIKTILFLAPFFFFIINLFFGWKQAICAITGIITSLLASLIGMSICVRANLHTANLAQDSEKKSFRSAVTGGSIMGLCITGFSLIVLSILFLIFKDAKILVGFGVGSSLAALFAQIGGGIFTKSADVGADLVGKVEEKIPEDDPRNPAVIADLVGDNVGDCAGRGADLFQTLSDDIITGTIVATTVVSKFGPKVIFFPFLLQCIGILSSTIAILVTINLRKNSEKSPFSLGLYLNVLLAAIGSYFLAKYLINDFFIWISILLGLGITLIAALTTNYYTGVNSKPVNEIAQASKRGSSLNLITGLAFGLKSPLASIIIIVSSIIFAFNLNGGAFLAIVAVNIGTDLLIAYIMAADAFGPIVDNAAGIAEMSKSSPKIINHLTKLDSLGNTMKAITKSYAMSSGTVTAFVTFATFFSITKISSLDVNNPQNVGFLLLGISLPYLISSLTIGSAAKGALLVVDEVRQQFKTIKGLKNNKAFPNYSRCVDITTKNALKEMISPGLISFLTPVFIGFIFGANALASLLIGAVFSSALLGPFFNNVGTAWDNAKKFVESHSSAKNTSQHAAAVTGDTVGDPLKDVAGPSLLIFMKLIGMTSLLIAPFLN